MEQDELQVSQICYTKSRFDCSVSFDNKAFGLQFQFHQVCFKLNFDRQNRYFNSIKGGKNGHRIHRFEICLLP